MVESVGPLDRAPQREVAVEEHVGPIESEDQEAVGRPGADPRHLSQRPLDVGVPHAGERLVAQAAVNNSQVILAELGPDMSRFPSDRHAASWVAICPGNDESAGKRRSGKTRRSNPHLRAALIESANAAARSENTYLRAKYEQVKRRRGHKKASPSPTRS